MNETQTVDAPQASPKTTPFEVKCQHCARDITGRCQALFTPPSADEPPQLIGVLQPIKCPHCGRPLLYRKAKSPVIVP